MVSEGGVRVSKLADPSDAVIFHVIINLCDDDGQGECDDTEPESHCSKNLMNG